MSDFLGNDNVNANSSALNKGLLHRMDVVWEMAFEMIRKSFGNYFVYDIAKEIGRAHV